MPTDTVVEIYVHGHDLYSRVWLLHVTKAIIAN